VNAVTGKSFFLAGLRGQGKGVTMTGRDDFGQYDEKKGAFRR
jgi:hypothetical protein